MPIFRTIPDSNFTILNNAIANDATVSATATTALLYLISKPPHWKFNAHDLKRRLNVGLNKVYRVMRELIRAGYATYQRIQSGTIWNIYDTPQNKETARPPVESHRVNFEYSQNKCLLESIDLLEINKQLPEPILEPQKAVVVSLDDKEKLIYPEKLNQEQKKACKAVIKKAPIHLQQDVLLELAYRMSMANLKSVPGYLNTLVTSANNGTFTRTGAVAATKADNRHIDDTQTTLAGYRALTTSKPDMVKAGIAGMFAAIRGVAQ